MKIIRRILKVVLTILAISVVYILVALVFTAIPVNTSRPKEAPVKSIYIHSNGVHLDVALPQENVGTELKEGLDYDSNTRYFSFGWSDKNFYLNTPTWGDLTFNTAFTALFLKSETLLHYTQYVDVSDDWKEVKVTPKQLQALNGYLNRSFKKDKQGKKIKTAAPGYGTRDCFYEANGYYTCFNTCNTWVNSGFKQADLKACLWTPFDFGLLSKY